MSVARSASRTATAALPRQAVAVARAAAFATKVVILDEPTAALGVRETRQVLDLIEILRKEGHGVILVLRAAAVAGAGAVDHFGVPINLASGLETTHLEGRWTRRLFV